MYIVINELEKDVLREIINISLARAADSFANFSKKAVLLAVPEIKIIEPRVLPDVIDEFEDEYQIIRAEIEGELSGKTFLLFSEEQTEKLAEACLNNTSKIDIQSKEALLITVSQIITRAIVDELHHLLQLQLKALPSEALFDYEQLPISYILEDLPAHQPFVIAIKTQFQKLVNPLELPLIVVLHANSVSKLLHILRQNNLYDFRLLQDKD
ncbi:hypothetical protein AHMF7605_12905 [Adhaeribacter arboris]|uniref:Uncharacterized protein n=1 Tax=Adhaeribacter arboris TaxID=2072846 RepID=A0A2T2YFW0_9BACT|nr:chemotaxis protein CheC [Adhaeribacter arboris]PSR54348.1 hypothetical protein AHMF7605_12905 [Adhaeribacter arboris]